jgi:hypothetical protein
VEDWATDRQVMVWTRLRLVMIPYSPTSSSQAATR